MQQNERQRRHLLGTEVVSGVHEVRADHRERDAVAMLSRKLHALLELVFKRRRVETDTVQHTHTTVINLDLAYVL